MMNSKAKGAAGERQWRDELRAAGFTARRGQQYAGGNESPDVICEELSGLHMEVKRVESLNLGKAIEQATRDAAGKPWIVAHRKNHEPWRVTMDSSLFFALLRDGMEAANAGGLCSQSDKLTR